VAVSSYTLTKVSVYISKGNSHASKDENTLAARKPKKETFSIEHNSTAKKE